MTSNKFAFYFLCIVFVTVVTHLLLVFGQVIEVDFRFSVVGDIALCFIFGMTLPIALNGIKKDSERFVGSFLIVTTIQMLLMLSLLAAYAYMKVPGFKTVSLQLVSLFVFLLAVQSFFLIKLVNNPNKKV